MKSTLIKIINQKYLIYVIPLYLFFFLGSQKYTLIFLVNFLNVLLYYLVLKFSYYQKDNFYNKYHLGIIVFIYSFFSVILFNILSYYYNGDFFVFSDQDAVYYHYTAIKLTSTNLLEGIKYFLRYNSFDDLGVVLIIRELYLLIESNLIVNLFYIIVGVITAQAIFRICLHFISRKYSFLAALSYSISSFVLFFHSTGLKESFMVMLIVLFFDRFYRYSLNSKKYDLIIGFLFAISLFLFRPAITFFLLASVGYSALFIKNRRAKFVLFIVIVFIISFYSFAVEIALHYTFGGLKPLIYAKESEAMIKGSVLFTYIVNTLAQLIGPFPTIPPDNKTMLSFFAPGLIYKMFISIPFWLGVFYIFKNNYSQLYPLIYFIFMEMFSLVFILEGLELRKSLPHFTIFYIIAFWFLDKSDSNQMILNKKRIKALINFSIIIQILLIIYWNNRMYTI